MSHMLEINNGKVSMAYAGETPWHNLGTKVSSNISPKDMLIAAGLDWEVTKIPTYGIIPEANINGQIIKSRTVKSSRELLVRTSDNRVIDEVTTDWKPVQNIEAFEFFNDFVTAGQMTMETAGSIKNGKIIWALAKVNESFDVFGGDVIDSYFLFTNFHKYGFSTDGRFTPIRVVCNNTITLALNAAVDRMMKFSHRKEFKPEVAKQMLGIAKNQLSQYKERVEFLGNKRAKNEDLVSYFKRIFPLTNITDRKEPIEQQEMSRNAEIAYDIMEKQPGAQYAPGTWWNAFNSCTFFVDHLAGRSDDSRMASSWYGVNKNTKIRALELAVNMAEAS